MTPKFFTWVEETYATPNDVPERIREQMRVLWLNGAMVDEIAITFNVPVEWVEDMVREAPRTTRPH